MEGTEQKESRKLPTIRPLLLSTTDQVGGASRAAYRLHQALRQIGVPAQMLVQTKSSDDDMVIGPNGKLAKRLAGLSPILNRLPLAPYRNREPVIFSPQWLPDGLRSKILQHAPDIIHLHWVCDGFLRIETLAKLNRPIIWTLHDMWPFTGGCHYTQGCERYTNSCGACPGLKSHSEWDVSHWIWQRKAKAWRKLNLTIVAPSNWIAECAKSSLLFNERRIEVIPYCIDTEVYRPVDPRRARDLLSLPQDKSLVLFGALHLTQERRKGFHLFQAALQKLISLGWGDKVEVVLFGASQNGEALDLGFKTHHLGQIHDDEMLASLYSAADAFVLPSTEDNLPNTVLEALGCGTPCVAFDVGGLRDLIDHRENGYLAPPFETDALAQGIVWVLTDENRRQKLSQRSRQRVEATFTPTNIAQRHLRLYQELVSGQMPKNKGHDRC